MSVIQLKGDVFLHKASHLYFTPWEVDASTNVLQPGTNTYDIVDILADTIAIEQGDPTTENVDWEFGDSPLMSTVTKGERTVAASCIDISDDILEFVYGWERKTYSTTSGTATAMVAEPTGMSDMYATLVVTFHGSSGAAAPIIVLPKIALGSKLVIGTLKTSTAQADLSGTAQAAYLEYGGGTTLSTALTATTEIAKITPIAGEDIACALASSNTPVSIGTITITNGEVSLT